MDPTLLEWRTPIRDTPPSWVDLGGHVCISPAGVPYWPSAQPTISDSLRICFGAADRRRLDEVAREGWICVPIAALVPAPAQREGR